MVLFIYADGTLKKIIFAGGIAYLCWQCCSKMIFANGIAYLCWWYCLMKMIFADGNVWRWLLLMVLLIYADGIVWREWFSLMVLPIYNDGTVWWWFSLMVLLQLDYAAGTIWRRLSHITVLASLMFSKQSSSHNFFCSNLQYPVLKVNFLLQFIYRYNVCSKSQNHKLLCNIVCFFLPFFVKNKHKILLHIMIIYILQSTVIYPHIQFSCTVKKSIVFKHDSCIILLVDERHKNPEFIVFNHLI